MSRNHCWACVAGFHILCGGCECCGRKRHHDHPSNAVLAGNALMLLSFGILLGLVGMFGTTPPPPDTYQTRKPTAVESEQHSAETDRAWAELELEDQARQLEADMRADMEGQQR